MTLTKSAVRGCKKKTLIHINPNPNYILFGGNKIILILNCIMTVKFEYKHTKYLLIYQKTTKFINISKIFIISS